MPTIIESTKRRANANQISLTLQRKIDSFVIEIITGCIGRRLWSKTTQKSRAITTIIIIIYFDARSNGDQWRNRPVVPARCHSIGEQCCVANQLLCMINIDCCRWHLEKSKICWLLLLLMTMCMTQYVENELFRCMIKKQIDGSR
jgi:hypothetical protein